MRFSASSIVQRNFLQNWIFKGKAKQNSMSTKHIFCLKYTFSRYILASLDSVFIPCHHLLFSEVMEMCLVWVFVLSFMTSEKGQSVVLAQLHTRTLVSRSAETTTRLSTFSTQVSSIRKPFLKTQEQVSCGVTRQQWMPTSSSSSLPAAPRHGTGASARAGTGKTPPLEAGMLVSLHTPRRSQT